MKRIDFLALALTLLLAIDGDTVLIADGTYTGFGNKNLSYGGKAITVQSVNGPENCIIDCERQGRGFVFGNYESSRAVLVGIAITNGSVESRGGAIYCSGSSPTISGCVIVDNEAGYRGGGVNCDHDSNAVFINSIFSANAVEHRGGGLFCDHGSNATLVNCVVNDNHAESFGSGIACDHASHAVVTNCTINANQGGGRGVIVSHGSNPIITNSIVWGNAGLQIGGQSGKLLVASSDVQGGWPGNGNIDSDPQFVDPQNADLRLLAGSPCIDAGDNDALPADEFDLDNDGDTDEPIPIDLAGEDRAQNGIVDMGAYEFQFQDACADDDGDGRVTICHLAPGNLSNARTIIVSMRALPAHLAHGDFCGPCERWRWLNLDAHSQRRHREVSYATSQRRHS